MSLDKSLDKCDSSEGGLYTRAVSQLPTRAGFESAHAQREGPADSFKTAVLSFTYIFCIFRL